MKICPNCGDYLEDKRQLNMPHLCKLLWNGHINGEITVKNERVSTQLRCRLCGSTAIDHTQKDCEENRKIQGPIL